MRALARKHNERDSERKMWRNNSRSLLFGLDFKAFLANPLMLWYWKKDPQRHMICLLQLHFRSIHFTVKSKNPKRCRQNEMEIVNRQVCVMCVRCKEDVPRYSNNIQSVVADAAFLQMISIFVVVTFLYHVPLRFVRFALITMPTINYIIILMSTRVLLLMVECNKMSYEMRSYNKWITKIRMEMGKCLEVRNWLAYSLSFRMCSATG